VRYRHTFRCQQCRQPLSFVTNNDDSEFMPGTGRPVPLPSLFHKELHDALGKGAEQQLTYPCLGRLLWEKTDALAPPVRPPPPPPDDPSHGEQILQAGRGQNLDQPTRAVMWCNETRQWHYGRCRHGAEPSDKNMPAPIAHCMLELHLEREVEADCYGTNCAEVQCVMKAYSAGRRAQDLAGCRFIAYNLTYDRWIDACKSCRVWIMKFGGSWRAQGSRWT